MVRTAVDSEGEQRRGDGSGGGASGEAVGADFQKLDGFRELSPWRTCGCVAHTRLPRDVDLLGQGQSWPVPGHYLDAKPHPTDIKSCQRIDLVTHSNFPINGL